MTQPEQHFSQLELKATGTNSTLGLTKSKNMELREVLVGLDDLKGIFQA